MIDLSKIVLRRLLARLAFLAIGLLLIYYYVNHLFISQLSNPVLVYPDLDNTYWLFLFLAIPQQIAGSISLSILIDSSLVVFLVLSFVFWKKPIFPICFLLLYVLYFITYNSFSCHHFHHTGVFFIVLPFCFSGSAFSLIFEFIRYYLCFIYASAGCYKLFRGTIFNTNQLVEVLRTTHLEALSKNELNPFLDFLLSTPFFSHSLFVFAVLLELFFLVGFFTKKLDYLLFIALIVMKVSLFLVMDFVAWELLVLDIIMIPSINKRLYESQVD